MRPGFPLWAPALVLFFAMGVSDAAAQKSGKSPSEKRYPDNRAAELKARLMEKGKHPDVPRWAVEYAESPEVGRLEPMPRAAEREWAARIGLAAGAASAEKAKLEAVLAGAASCAADSVAVKRAAQGLTKVGVVVPLSGRYERFGETFVNGLRVAVEEHNREWAPPIGLILHDSEGDPLVGARKARWLLKDHGVSLLVGEILSANTAPLAAATQVLDAVLISPSATNERLAILGEGVFQLHIGPQTSASALARHLAGVAPRATAGILVARTREDSTLAAEVAKACDFAAIRIVGTERVKETEADLTKELKALQSKKPTALILIGPPRLMGIAGAQLPTTWPGARVFGFHSLDPEELDPEARQGLEGAVFFLSDYALDGAPADSFRARYQRAHKAEPTRMSVRGYLTGLAIARAVESGAINASTLREGLRAQLYPNEEDRRLRALKPAIGAYPERLAIRGGKGVPVSEVAIDP
ncbi:MAG TPA: ABC transporter substrate-binding protein, partial [Candidatus Eisenbacteria bacterium]|nr:ABC transporter substrate-binding protein [Candidatus Eisenbacteria bacterium]